MQNCSNSTNPSRNERPTVTSDGITVVLNTYNHIKTIEACLRGVLNQDKLGPLEIIVVDDGSDDGTCTLVRAAVSKFRPGVSWKVYQLTQYGGVKCRQFGLEQASYDLCLLLGGDFVLTDPRILGRLVAAFQPNTAFVSLYGPHGGMGTLYRRAVVMETGGFSLDFNRFGSGYRDDSDLYYRLSDRGFTSVFLEEEHSAFLHLQPAPQGLWAKFRYAFWRAAIHQLDALLFKRHRKHFTRDFCVRCGFFVDPRVDYMRATGRWREGASVRLASPQGVVLLEGSATTSRIVIYSAGVVYACLLVLFRLIGSIRYRTVLL